MIRKRNLYFKKARHSGDKSDYQKFRQLRNKVVAKLRNLKREYLSRLNPREPKEFWKLVKSLNSKENLLPTLKSGDIIASADLDKPNLLNNAFMNNCTYSVPGLSPCDLPAVVLPVSPPAFLFTAD